MQGLMNVKMFLIALVMPFYNRKNKKLNKSVIFYEDL